MKYRIDKNNFFNGTIADEFAGNLSVVNTPPPDMDSDKSPKWNGSGWEAVIDYRKGLWYDPLNSANIFVGANFNDIPPAYYAKATLGEIKISEEEKSAKINNYIFDPELRQWYDPRTPETEWPLVRAKRDQLLAASDWTDTLSAPGRLGAEAYDAWQDYRQALRDVTGQVDPFALVWPVAPGPT